MRYTRVSNRVERDGQTLAEAYEPDDADAIAAELNRLDERAKAVASQAETLCSWLNLAKHRGVGGHGPSERDIDKAIIIATAEIRRVRGEVKDG